MDAKYNRNLLQSSSEEYILRSKSAITKNGTKNQNNNLDMWQSEALYQQNEMTYAQTLKKRSEQRRTARSSSRLKAAKSLDQTIDRDLMSNIIDVNFLKSIDGIEKAIQEVVGDTNRLMETEISNLLINEDDGDLIYKSNSRQKKNDVDQLNKDSDSENMIQKLLAQFQEYNEQVQEKNIWIQVSLDNHLIKSYFDKIKQMNEHTIEENFCRLRQLTSKPVPDATNKSQPLKNSGNQNFHFVLANDASNIEQGQYYQFYLIQQVYDHNQRQLLIRFHSQVDKNTKYLSEFMMNDVSSFDRRIHCSFAGFQQQDKYVYFFKIQESDLVGIEPSEPTKWILKPFKFDFLMKQTTSAKSKLKDITYESLFSSEQKGTPLAVLFVKQLKVKHKETRHCHDQIPENQLIVIVEKVTVNEYNIPLKQRAPIKLQFRIINQTPPKLKIDDQVVDKLNRFVYSVQKENGIMHNIELKSLNINLNQPLYIIQLAKKHIKDVEDFQNYDKIKNLIVVVTFKTASSHLQSSKKHEPDIMAVLSYDKDRQTLSDLQYPQGVNDYSRFLEENTRNPKADIIIKNHHALVKYFEFLGYNNSCYRTKYDKKHQSKVYMKQYLSCKRQLNCLKELGNYVISGSEGIQNYHEGSTADQWTDANFSVSVMIDYISLKIFSFVYLHDRVEKEISHNQIIEMKLMPRLHVMDQNYLENQFNYQGLFFNLFKRDTTFCPQYMISNKFENIARNHYYVYLLTEEELDDNQKQQQSHRSHNHVVNKYEQKLILNQLQDEHFKIKYFSPHNLVVSANIAKLKQLINSKTVLQCSPISETINSDFLQ